MKQNDPHQNVQVNVRTDTSGALVLQKSEVTLNSWESYVLTQELTQTERLCLLPQTTAEKEKFPTKPHSEKSRFNFFFRLKHINLVYLLAWLWWLGLVTLCCVNTTGQLQRSNKNFQPNSIKKSQILTNVQISSHLLLIKKITHFNFNCFNFQCWITAKNVFCSPDDWKKKQRQQRTQKSHADNQFTQTELLSVG